MQTKTNFPNPYDGTIAHEVHPSVVDYFLTDYPRSDYPAHTNTAIEWNQSLAQSGYRCLHTNGNHTVWEGLRGRITVSMCEIPTVTINPIKD